MKKLTFSLILLAIAFFSNAQDLAFKPFKVDFSGGYATPSSGNGAKGGALFAIEPKYALTDNLTVGLRMEAALMVRASLDPNATDAGDVKGSASYLATADYYFNTNDFRPFVGVGAGLYQTATADLSSSTGEVNSGNKFGVAPRVGFEYSHFRLAVEYNVAGKTGDINNSYLGIKLGFFVGGGRNE